MLQLLWQCVCWVVVTEWMVELRMPVGLHDDDRNAELIIKGMEADDWKLSTLMLS